jgi:ribosomal protein L35AE/L33A
MILIKVTYSSTQPTIKVTYDVTNITVSGGSTAPVYVNLDYSASGAATNITSVGLTMPAAFTVTNSPLTISGTIAVTGAGTGAQYIKGDGTLATFPTTINQSLTLIREVYNSTGATLAKGTVVYINGGQGNLPTVTKALAVGDTTSAQTFGIVQSDITNQNNGYVVVAGGINSLDTQAYAAGTALYLSPTTAGAYTSTKPYAPQHIVYIGVVVRSHPTMGVIEVKIQNGYELDELHNVAAQNPDDGMIISYVASTQLWTKTNTIDLGTW